MISLYSRKKAANALKHSSAVFLLALGAQVQADDSIAKALSSSGALVKAQFLELCKANVVDGKRPSPTEDSCLMYFHALRDGYVGGQMKAIQRAAVYYELNGEVPPAAELDLKYVKESLGGLDKKPNLQLESHATACLKKIPTQQLLEEFYAYVQHARPLWGMAITFDEFAQRKYAGKCKGTELAAPTAPAPSLTPTPVGEPTEPWHGSYKMKLPEGMPEGFEIDIVMTFGNQGFGIKSDGKDAATGTYEKLSDEIVLQPRWGQYLKEGARVAIESDSLLRMEGAQGAQFEKVAP